MQTVKPKPVQDMTTEDLESEYASHDICTCGHCRLMHFSLAVAIGHGKCRVCACKQFTFASQDDPYRAMELVKEIERRYHYRKS